MFKNKLKEVGKNPQEKTFALAEFTKSKAKLAFGFFLNHFDIVRKEFEIIKEKSKNLLESNYQLGLMHQDKGNLSDAIFRFRFIKKFWPHHYDSYIQLANCYISKKRFNRALQVLDELLIANSTYENQVQELKNKIHELQSTDNI